MRRLIREVEPPRPSARLSTLDDLRQSTLSTIRKIDARELSWRLWGELDWIVMNALDKTGTRRYESASALAADIAHYLNDVPVVACPPTTASRFSKFARRHMAALATTALVAAALVAAALVLGLVGTVWQV